MEVFPTLFTLALFLVLAGSVNRVWTAEGKARKDALVNERVLDFQKSVLLHVDRHVPEMWVVRVLNAVAALAQPAATSDALLLKYAIGFAQPWNIR